MTSALYEYSLDRIDVLDRRVQGKDKTKSLPAKSPDVAHAFILGARHYLRQTTLEEPVEPPRDQGDVLWRKVQEAVNREIAPKFIDPYRRRR